MNAPFERLLSRILNISLDFGDGVLRHLWPPDIIEEPTLKTTKYDRRLFLKIKLKTLLDETRLIQSYEERIRNKIDSGANPESRWYLESLLTQMREHRRTDIREEVRATLLAYGYIRGRTYNQIEERRNPEPSHRVMKRAQRVYRMVAKYSVMTLVDTDITEDAICDWMRIDKNQYKYWLTRDPRFLRCVTS